MSNWNLHHWLSGLTGRTRLAAAAAPAKSRTRLGRPLTLQSLEERVVPATFIWTGAGDGVNWSNAGNWNLLVAPTGDGTEDLAFGASAAGTVRNTNNDLVVNSNPNSAPIFNSITISASGYRIAGNAVTLGNVNQPSSGNIIVNNGAINNVIDTSIALGGAGGGNRQFITVNTGSELLVSGSISGTTGVELTKSGTGVLTLGNDNSGFTGAIKINDNSGVLQVTNANALGDTNGNTTVGANSTLRILGAGEIRESLILNGLGFNNEGALVNDQGTNVISGSVLLDSDAAIGGTSGVLQITGVISDSGSGRNLTKEGTGVVALAAANTYRGRTTVNNGILRVQNDLALGTQLGAFDGTIVTQTLGKVGTLQLDASLTVNRPVNPGKITILDEVLTLNGAGFQVGVDSINNPITIGALSNLDGDNEYAGSVIIGGASVAGDPARNVVIGVEPGTIAGSQLTLSGVVSSPNGTFSITKNRQGKLIFNNANTYTGTTLVDEGILSARDSRALGTVGGSTSVNSGAQLVYEVDGIPGTQQTDAHGRNLGLDSVTGVANRLNFSENLFLAGTGVNGTGALRSFSGINRQIGEVNLDFASGTANADPGFVERGSIAIGVDPDPNASSTAAYFTNDYSLTVNGDIDSDERRNLIKTGAGQLILPRDNSYLAATEIQQGWVTVRSANALGAFLVGRGETAQPLTIVRNGAALHLKALTPTGSFTLPENLILDGNGITHPNALISQKGALMNITGTNTVSGDIQLTNVVGVGVETVDAGSTSELTTTGTVSDLTGFRVGTDSAGDENENSNIIDTGATSGVVELSYNHFFAPDQTRLYYPPRGTPGSTLLFDTGLVGTNGTIITVRIPYNGTSTFVEIVVNEGGTMPGTVWEYTARIFPNSTGGAIDKLGSKRLRLQGDGTYTGNNTVTEGVLTVQHNSALGTASGSTTVLAGAAIELDRGIAVNNGGIAGGVQVLGESLILNGTGNTSVTGSLIQPLTVMNGDHMWTGSVTMNNSVNLDIQADSRLLLSGPLNDTGSTLGAGFTKLGTGELVLSAVNTYRGVTNVSQGVVTIQNGLALGTVDGGTVVSTGASLQIQGNISVAGESLSVSGTGTSTVPSTMPIRWFASGPAPIVNGETPGNLNAAGRVNAVTIDPTDSQVIYIATAGGGAWKTKNGGRTWLPLLDNIRDSAGNLISAQTLFAGAVAVAPNVISFNQNDTSLTPTLPALRYDPRKIYVGTGDGNNSADSFYGRGVLRSTDSGDSWTLIAPTVAGVNLFDRKAINKVVVDPLDSDIIYVAVGNPANGADPNNRGNNGIWRFNATLPDGVGAGFRWENLTALKGPTDNTAFQFTEFDNYSDLDVKIRPTGAGGQRIIVMSVGNANGSTIDNLGPGGTVRVVSGGTATTNNFRNAPYISVNSGATWTSAGFVTQQDQTINNVTLRFPNAGNIKVALSNQIQVFGDQTPDNFVAYATVSYPSTGFNTTNSAGFGFPVEDGNLNLENRLTAVFRSNITWDAANGVYVASAWTAVTTPPDFMVNVDPATLLNRGRGDYANAVIVDPTNANVVYVAGVGQTTGRGVLRSTDGGASWTDIGIGADGTGAHPYAHGFGFSTSGTLYIATDGGLYSTETSGNPPVSWASRNGNLAVTQFNSISTNPFNFTNAIGGSQGNGVDVLNGSTWTQTDNGNGGRVVFDPSNPLTAYSVIETPGTTLLRRSTNGGTTWTTILTLSAPVPAGQGGVVNRNGNVTPVPVQAFPLVLDTIRTSRIVVGGPGGVRESSDGGNSFVNLNAPITASKIALGVFEGQFALDPGFPTVTQPLGANVYNPNTIYVTNGTQVAVTKNRGGTWVTRSAGLPGGIQDIIVDPRNRDTAYVVSNNFTGGRVFMTTNAGQNWIDITGNLPAGLPVYKAVIDPRVGSPTNQPTGDLYIGTDNGVFVLRAGTTTWSQFGLGLPNVQVRDLELDLSKNTLTAGTYGRSMYTYYIPSVVLNGGALRAISGQSTWSGTITMTGATNLGAAGSQNLANGASSALLNITGVIRDDVSGANHAVNKIGGGTIVFSGSNTYGGLTTVQAGVLGSNNRTALGSPGSGTVVQAGAALSLQSNLDLEPITINGDGFTFNGHNSGALRNESGNNTYTGPLTMGTNTTVGVDSGTQLTITNVVSDGGANLNLTKELTGTLILSGANTYGGQTNINQGALRAASNTALGTTGAPTRVLDGAQLQLAGNVTLGEAVQVSGEGIDQTGAILNLSGNNAITGTVTLSSLPNFSPVTVPPPRVRVNVLGAADTLTFSGVVNQTGGTFDLDKIGSGRLTLGNANSYGGVTNVIGGALRVQNNNSLGTTAAGTVVSSGAQLEIDGSFNIGSEALTLNGNGSTLIAPVNSGALQSVSGNSTYGGPISLATNASVGGLAGSSLTITGVISDPTNSSLTKLGQNTVTLAAANTYRGLTTVTNGVLGITNAGALGSGPAGTLVQAGGTLQVSGGITVTAEDLTLNGGGSGGIGAINNLSGTNTWDRLITLGSNTSLGSTAGLLNLNQPLTDGASVFNVTKVGAGSVAYTGNNSNLYDGSTAVNEGTLVLSKTGGATPFTGALVVGDNLAGTGTVQLTQSNQLPDSSPITVNSDGVLDLNGQTDSVGPLGVTDGSVNTGNNGVLNVNALSMTGGTVTTGTAGSVVLTGTVSATSSATQTASINGSGSLNLGGATRNFSVADGPQRVDFAVNVPTVDQVGEGIVKTGAGRLAFGANNTFVGGTSVSAGDVEVTGTLGNVTLGSGTASVSGSGTIGNVTGVPTANGSVSPGLNGAGGTTGVLTTDSLILGANSTVRVDLNGPTPGTDYDQIVSNGAVSLGGAQLSGSVGILALGDQFTIIQTSGSAITGRFAEPFGPNVAFIGGRKFDVDYTDPTKVVLTLVQSGVTVGVTSSANSAVFGQPVLFTATVTPEAGAASASVAGQVRFDLTGPSGTFTRTETLNPSRQAVFNPVALFGSLLPGSYSLDVTYLGNANFNGAATTLSPLQVIVPSATTTSIFTTPNPSNFNTPVTIRVVVAGQFPGTVPQGSVSVSINGGAATTLALVNGQATLTTSSLPRGSNSIVATYLGDDPTGGFTGSSRTASTFVNPPGVNGGGGGGGGGGGVNPPRPIADPLTKPVVVYGADGGGSHVRVIDAVTGQETLSIFAYNPTFLGGVRVALGDVNGDGVFDVVTAAGPGAAPHIRVFSGTNGSELLSFFAYDSSFSGGVNVASGDVNGDGFADVITGAGPGAGPHVKIFDGRTGQEISSFFAYGPTFSGGVNLAAGDVNGDGFADIITGSAALASHVKVFDGRTVTEVQSFFAYTPLYSGGVNVAVGDINGDGLADIITGAGGTGSPHIRAFRGDNLTELASFFAFPTDIQRGVRVASVDANRDGRSEIVVGQGFGGKVRRFDPLVGGGTLVDEFMPFEVTGLGVYVG